MKTWDGIRLTTWDDIIEDYLDLICYNLTSKHGIDLLPYVGITFPSYCSPSIRAKDYISFNIKVVSSPNGPKLEVDCLSYRDPRSPYKVEQNFGLAWYLAMTSFIKGYDDVINHLLSYINSVDGASISEMFNRCKNIIVEKKTGNAPKYVIQLVQNDGTPLFARKNGEIVFRIEDSVSFSNMSEAIEEMERLRKHIKEPARLEIIEAP